MPDDDVIAETQAADNAVLAASKVFVLWNALTPEQQASLPTDFQVAMGVMGDLLMEIQQT